MVSSSHFWNADGPGSWCAAGGFGSNDGAAPGSAADGAGEVDAGGAAGPEAGGAARSVVDGAAGPDAGGSVGPAVAGPGSADGGSATAAACPSVRAQPIASVTATLRRHFTTTHPPCQSCTRTEGRAEMEQSRQIRHTGARVGSDRHRTDFRKIPPDRQTPGDLRRPTISCPRAVWTQRRPLLRQSRRRNRRVRYSADAVFEKEPSTVRARRITTAARTINRRPKLR